MQTFSFASAASFRDLAGNSTIRTQPSTPKHSTAGGSRRCRKIVHAVFGCYSGNGWPFVSGPSQMRNKPAR